MTSAQVDTTHYDVIIVGAGQCGLAAAHRLAIANKQSVLVLEASDHVGGRTRNMDLGTEKLDGVSDDSYELGGTWLSPKHTAVLRLLSEIGLEVFDASFLKKRGGGDDDLAAKIGDSHKDIKGPRKEGKEEEEWPWWFWGVEYSDEEMERINKIILHLQPSIKEGLPRKVAFQSPTELFQALDENTRNELDNVGRRIENDAQALGNGNCWQMQSPGSAWAGLDVHSTSSVLLGEDGNSNQKKGLLSTPDSRSILRNVIRNKNADDPDRVSYLYNLISFKGCNSDGADTQYRVRGGTQAIPARIADLLNNNGDQSVVLLNVPVRRLRVLSNKSSETEITLSNEGRVMDKATKDMRVEVETKDGRIYTAKAVIVTGAPPAVGKISFEPELPLAQKRLLEQMPMGKSMKFAAVYNRGPWWRHHGLQGDILASGLPKELSVPGPDGHEASPLFGYCFDMSPFSQKVGVLSCFCEGSSYQYFTSLSQDRQQELMREFLRLSFEDTIDEEDGGKVHDDSQPIWEPDSFVVADWGPDNPFVCGAYTSYFPPGVLSDPDTWRAYRQQEKLPNVFLSGADYYAGFGNGYIEGAVRSGQEAADMILERISRC